MAVPKLDPQDLGRAIAFLTRLPVPAHLHRFEAGDLRRSLGWFPVVGALVGAITATIAVLGARVWPVSVAVLVALAVEARLTGAFHEDALADAADGLGGGWTRERVLEILKDSRLGAYGALALLLGVLLRFTTLAGIPPDRFVVGLIGSTCLARLSIPFLLHLCPPIPGRAGLSSDLAGGLSRDELLLPAIFASPVVVWMVWVSPARTILALALATGFVVWAALQLQRRLAGCTGDLLGAVAFVVQILVLLAWVWRDSGS